MGWNIAATVVERGVVPVGLLEISMLLFLVIRSRSEPHAGQVHGQVMRQVGCQVPRQMPAKSPGKWGGK